MPWPATTVVETPAEPAPAPAPPDRWMLMKALQGTYAGSLLDENRLQISGWTNVSYTASSASQINLPMGFNYLADEFVMQQNWLRIERSVVTSGTSEPTYGFRSDTILPGTDYRLTMSRGLFDGQLTANNGNPNLYGFDPIQFYAEAYYPAVGRGLDIKVGRFFAQYGVQTADGPGNALLSHSYTYAYDPVTQTGVLGTLKLTDTWSVQAGMVLGSDIFIDPADEPTGIGSVKWAPPDGLDSVLFAVIMGPGRFDQQHNFHHPQVFDIVYSHRFNPRTVYNFEGLYGYTTNVPSTGFANWYGILNYLTYDFSPRLSGTTRVEFFEDAQGQRTGFSGLYSAVTAGLSFKPYKSVTIRPELRYDYNADSRPFENRHGLFTATSDLILRW